MKNIAPVQSFQLINSLTKYEVVLIDNNIAGINIIHFIYRKEKNYISHKEKRIALSYTITPCTLDTEY